MTKKNKSKNKLKKIKEKDKEIETYQKTRKNKYVGKRKEEADIAQTSMLKNKEKKESHFQKFYGKNKEGSTETSVLEKIEGKSLDKWIKDKKGKEKNKEEMINQFAEIAKELTKKGVTHRDISPKNMIVKEKGEKPFIKLIDFEKARKTSKENFKTEKNMKREMEKLTDTLTATLMKMPQTKYEKIAKTEEKYIPESKMELKKKIEEKREEVKEELFEAYEKKIEKMHEKRKTK